MPALRRLRPRRHPVRRRRWPIAPTIDPAASIMFSHRRGDTDDGAGSAGCRSSAGRPASCAPARSCSCGSHRLVQALLIAARVSGVAGRQTAVTHHHLRDTEPVDHRDRHLVAGLPARRESAGLTGLDRGFRDEGLGADVVGLALCASTAAARPFRSPLPAVTRDAPASWGPRHLRIASARVDWRARAARRNDRGRARDHHRRRAPARIWRRRQRPADAPPGRCWRSRPPHRR